MQQDCELVSLVGSGTMDAPVDLGEITDSFLNLLKVNDGHHVGPKLILSVQPPLAREPGVCVSLLRWRKSFLWLGSSTDRKEAKRRLLSNPCCLTSGEWRVGKCLCSHDRWCVFNKQQEFCQLNSVLCKLYTDYMSAL